MNRWIRPCLLLAFLLSSSLIFANRVVVKGTVKFANGIVVSNFPIVLQTDTVTTNAGCNVTKSVVTGTNGAYDAGIECISNILKVYIGYKDCNGHYTRVMKEVPATGIIEYNIVLCTPTNCVASFTTAQSAANPGNIQFYSNGSSASTAYPDEIISRRWTWGDGTSTDGNLVNTYHIYAAPGEYEVCLVIKTRNGCESKTCHKVVVNATNIECLAQFVMEKLDGPNQWQFFDTSKAANTDEIVSRRWTWGDGSAALEGNIKYPKHAFPGPGSYEVCLQIKTKLGCDKRICKTVIIQPETCKAYFITELLPVASNTAPNTFKFNSSASFGGNPASSIIARRWDFGDGKIMEGNTISPNHVYSVPGTYRVCLTIKTDNNCTATLCKDVVVVAAACKAVFKWEPIPGTVANPPASFMAFYGGGSHSSNPNATIIGRRWTFGDGTSLESLDSTVKHGYARPGTYTVCLYIKTSDGCYDSICNNVVVPNPPNTACVPGFNWQADKLSVHFNSNISAIATGDNIVKRTWSFGDGTGMDGNVTDPVHKYAHAGEYEVCLAIVTSNGCQQKICKKVIVTTCEAVFRWETGPVYTNPGAYVIKFFSGASHGWSNNYPVIGRKWTFGDGKTTESPDSNVNHTYLQPGTYTVCLYIKTSDGCYDSACRVINIPAPVNTACHAAYNWTSNGTEVKFNSNTSDAATGDNIIKRTWSFGDGTGADGNIAEPVHHYANAGVYEVCLTITTDKGCQHKICKQVTVTKCEAVFRWEPIATNTTSPPSYYFKFFSGASHGWSNNYPVIGRRWTFGDGTVLETNDSNVTHKYAAPGQYVVCLTVKTSDGCYDSTCKTLVIPNTAMAPSCKATFAWTSEGLKGKFNSTNSAVAAGDSIVKRTWIFGDGTKEDGNHIFADHVYPHDGQYEVCLVIVTKSGCEQRSCQTIVVSGMNAKCFPLFKFENVAPGKLAFNSSPSYSQVPNDLIVKRIWSFGDGTGLTGNIINPSHEYRAPGFYTVCLRIVTAAGCENTWCQQVKVEGQQNRDSADIKLVSLYPNPASVVTLAVIWSKHNNIPATLAVYDIYGARKWSMQTILPQGNSTWQVNIANLATGPYIFKIITQYGVQNRQFFKVN